MYIFNSISYSTSRHIQLMPSNVPSVKSSFHPRVTFINTSENTAQRIFQQKTREEVDNEKNDMSVMNARKNLIHHMVWR